MGGRSSGRWNCHEKKRTTEECWALDVAALPQGLRHNSSIPGVLRAVKIDNKGSVLRVRYVLQPSTETGPLVVLSYHLDRGTAEQELVEPAHLLTTRPNYGGARSWFACPLSSQGGPCGRRVGKLYLPPGEQWFGCRQCHALTYKSCQESHRYDRLCALMAGEDSGKTFEAVKRTFLTNTRKARRRSTRVPRGPLEVFDEVFGQR